MIVLVRPASAHQDAAQDYMKEYQEHFEKRINGSCGLHHSTDYSEWLKRVRKSETMPLTEFTTPADTFFAIRFEDDRIVGTIQVRHSITEALKECGGHIGYGVRPTERHKGYATMMLTAALHHAKTIGLKQVRVDCNKSNIASARTIIKCGGVFEREFEYAHAGCSLEVIQHYWMDTEQY